MRTNNGRKAVWMLALVGLAVVLFSLNKLNAESKQVSETRTNAYQQAFDFAQNPNR